MIQSNINPIKYEIKMFILWIGPTLLYPRFDSVNLKDFQ